MRDLIERGLGLHRAGRLAEAEALYREVLEQQPSHAVALHLMGVLAIQTGRFDAAVDWIGQAIASQPDFPEALNNLGNALKALGRSDDAVQAYGNALAQRPDFPEALNNRGVCLQALGRTEEAAAALERAVALKPDYPEARINHALALESLGRLDEAASAYAAASALLPQSSDLRNTLGNTLRTLGRLDEAAEAYGEAARLRPDFVEFHINHGVALTDCRRLDAAIACLRHALTLAPDHGRAMVALGVALSLNGDFTDAVAVLQTAIRAAPDFPPAQINLGLALLRVGRLDEAAECQRAALRLQPDNAVAHNNLAIVLTEMGRLDQALASTGAALGLRPDFAEARMAQGNVLKAMGRLSDAAASLETAVRLKPGSAEARTALGSIRQAQWRLDDAEAEHREALLLWPDYPAALMNLGATLQSLGRPAEAAACYDRIVAAQPSHDMAFGNLLNCAMYRDDLDNAALAEVHRRFGRAFAHPIPAMVKAEPDAAERRLKIGYLSSDLRNHPVATNLLPVVRNHSRLGFAVHFYAHVTTPDAYTQDFQALADGWRDIRGLTDQQAAEAIRADGIDILISLAGRFDLNRPGICAWRAAPIQITMHDVATSGLAEMDYIIGDGRLLARPSSEYFTERRLRLPSFYIADFPATLPPLAASPRQGPAVFGCFNNPVKITPTATRLWGEILAALPDSRLVLKFHQAYGSVPLRRRLLGQITAAGALTGQVVFAAEADSYGEFLARYNDVDIALDTMPFSGSTTSFQALTMGVPIVTLAVDRMAGRWTASMLRSLPLPQLIATKPEDYVAIAIATARNVNHWRTRRQEIRDRVAASSLCDGATWAKRLERLYRAVWRRHCAGVPPHATAKPCGG